MSETLELRIDKAVYGGAGLARHEGKAIFTPLTLPGEFVTAAVTRSKGSFAEAALVSVLEPSSDRATPPCPYFGACGGCHYQHGSYEAQLAIKRAILEETLTRARLHTLPPIDTHAGAPLGYRNRIRLHLDAHSSALGYRERASHHLLPVAECPIAAPELQQALAALAPICKQQQCGRLFDELELSTNEIGSAVLLALRQRAGASMADPARQLRTICEVLQEVMPALRGAGIFAAPAARQPPTGKHPQNRARAQVRRAVEGSDKDGVVDGLADESAPGALIASWGEPRMHYRVGEDRYQLSLGSFFQVNRSLVERLRDLATAGRAGALAWDLYAGVGLFSVALARQFEQVIAVEGAPLSARDLRANLGKPHLPVESSTLAFLQRETEASGRLRARGKRPDFVLVDPPRAGLGPEIVRVLAAVRPAHITYVSCDPATLARDLHGLLESPYQLKQLHLVDLFPQTFHLETVAMLSLG